MLSKPYLRYKIPHEVQAINTKYIANGDELQIGYDDSLHICTLKGSPLYATIICLFAQLYFDQEIVQYVNGAATFLCKEEVFRKGIREMTKDNVWRTN
jgi:hypothetical protein